jgi:hypothetical protein
MTYPLAALSVALAGDQEMQKYRVYVIGQDRRTEFRVDLFCYDDDAARERASNSRTAAT